MYLENGCDFFLFLFYMDKKYGRNYEINLFYVEKKAQGLRRFIFCDLI